MPGTASSLTEDERDDLYLFVRELATKANDIHRIFKSRGKTAVKEIDGFVKRAPNSAEAKALQTIIKPFLKSVLKARESSKKMEKSSGPFSKDKVEYKKFKSLVDKAFKDAAGVDVYANGFWKNGKIVQLGPGFSSIKNQCNPQMFPQVFDDLYKIYKKLPKA